MVVTAKEFKAFSQDSENGVLTAKISDKIRGELIPYGLILAAGGKGGSTQECVCDEATNVAQEGYGYRYPPSTSIPWQSFGEIIVEGQEGSFDCPNRGEEKVGVCPLILGIAVYQFLEVYRWMVMR